MVLVTNALCALLRGCQLPESRVREAQGGGCFCLGEGGWRSTVLATTKPHTPLRNTTQHHNNTTQHNTHTHVHTPLQHHTQRACVSLLYEAALLCDDDTRLQRAVPFLLTQVSDSATVVRALALRCLVRLVESVRALPPGDAKAYRDYLLPSLSLLPRDGEEAVRVEYALAAAHLAAAAHRHLLQLQFSSGGGGGGAGGGAEGADASAAETGGGGGGEGGAASSNSNAPVR